MMQKSLYDFFPQKGKQAKLKNSTNERKILKRPIKEEADIKFYKEHESKTDENETDKKVFKNCSQDPDDDYSQITQLSPEFLFHREQSTVVDLTDGTDNENVDPWLEITINEEINYWNVNNFRKMLKFINSKTHMQKLFTETDIRILTLLDNLKEEYLYLLLKLFTYLPKWYNVYKFTNRIKLKSKAEEVNLMYEQLQKNCLILTGYKDETAEVLLNLLQVAQVKKVAKTYKLPSKKLSLRKKDLIEAIIEQCIKQPTISSSESRYDVLRKNVKKEMGLSMKLDPLVHKTLYKVFVLYTIGTNLYKLSDVSLFMIRMNTNEIILPTIKVQDVDLFATKDAFERYAEAREEYSKFLTAFDKKDKKCMESIARNSYNKLFNITKNNNAPPLKKYLSEEYLYVKILCVASQHLTKCCDTSIVVDWLKILLRLKCHSKHGFCYKQLSLINARYIKSNNEAAIYLLEGLKDKNLSQIDLSTLKERANASLKSKTDVVCDEIRSAIEDVQIFQPNINVLKKRNIVAKTISSEITGNRKMYILADCDNTTYTSVELIALNHYKKKLGYSYGIHCEGSLISTLFSVLFWDIIYDENVPDVFITELQYLPFDLYSSDFYKNRENLIKERLNEIGFKWESYKLHDFVRTTWDTHSFKRSLITMTMFQADMLFSIIICIGRDKLAAILERLVSNFKEFNAGLPDLFMWDPVKLICKFVEVKGEGDKLSMKQKFWLDFLHVNEIDCEVCLVKTAASHRKHDIS